MGKHKTLKNIAILFILDAVESEVPQELPPRMWRRHLGSSFFEARSRVTSARAEKTFHGAGPLLYAPTHLRACGEDASSMFQCGQTIGSPPRGRRRRRRDDLATVRLRVTSARAEKTPGRSRDRNQTSVHLRASGEGPNAIYNVPDIMG